MTWFFVALLAPFFWSVSVYIDKYLVDDKLKGFGIGSVMIFSAVIGIFLLPIIFFIHPEVVFVELSYALFAIIGGFLYILCALPYFYALKKDEASVIVPIYQTIPIFGYVLAFIFLKEVLNVGQIFSSILIIIGAVVLSVDLSGKKFRFKHEIFWLVLLSSFLAALNGFIFKMLAVESDFWTTSFWEYVGFTISALLLLFVKSYRKQFFSVFRENALFMVNINALNEIVNISGKITMNIATIMAPLALAWVVNGFQPLIMLILGITITKFFPGIGTEKISKGHIFHKIVAIALMFSGAILLNIFS
ncbi:MAG: EamA family transporter [Candidatus Moranbacteria bacterium]|nr:EamA family transporter [Candidatus Moranbacteria bacterium]